MLNGIPGRHTLNRLRPTVRLFNSSGAPSSVMLWAYSNLDDGDYCMRYTIENDSWAFYRLNPDQAIMPSGDVQS